MTGNDSKGFVLQDRDRHLLRELAVMRVIDREQAKMVAGFGSTTRANCRLLALTRAALLHRFFQGTAAGGKRALYVLTARAATIVDVPYRNLRRSPNAILIADFFVTHQLAINNIYCALKYKPIPVPEVKFLRWMGFYEPLEAGSSLVPDGYAEVVGPNRTLSAFFEIDLGHEGRNVWKAKIARYLEYAVTGGFERQFHQAQFRVLVITNSERQLELIRSVAAELTEKVFWFSTFESINRDGFWSPIWLRPKGNERQSLL